MATIAETIASMYAHVEEAYTKTPAVPEHKNLENLPFAILGVDPGTTLVTPAELKNKLTAGTASSQIPVGSKIAAQFNGVSCPWTVVHYGQAYNSSGTLVDGVYLLCDYVILEDQPWNSQTTWNFTTSSVFTTLNNVTISEISTDLSSLMTSIRMYVRPGSTNNNASLTYTNAKLCAPNCEQLWMADPMSGTRPVGAQGGAWDYFKAVVGQTSPPSGSQYQTGAVLAPERIRKSISTGKASSYILTNIQYWDAAYHETWCTQQGGSGVYFGLPNSWTDVCPFCFIAK